MSEDFYRQVTEPFASLEFLATQVVEGFITGLHRSPFHGFSVEFAEHRQYNQGESVRYVDWKLYGRTDRLYVKKFQEETNLRCHILIDTSSSMYFPVSDRFDLSHPDQLGLSVCSVQTEVKSNSSHLKYLMSELEKRLIREKGRPALQQGSDIVETLHLAAEQIHKRSLIILFSDMFDGEYEMAALLGALQHLKYRNNEVILFHVTEKNREADFVFPGKHYCLVDLESGKEIKLDPSQYREAYVERYRAYMSMLKDCCEQYRIDFVETDIAQGFVPVLQAYLAKRERIFK